MTDFTKIKEAVIKAQAKEWCSSTNHDKSLRPEYTQYFYPRILGKVIVDSITEDFYTILQNYAGDELAGDGPFLLWLLLTHFHTSTNTYQQQVKQHIRSRSLAKDHGEDVESDLLWLRHQLDILQATTTGGIEANPDLLDPIFAQLLTTKSTRLPRIVEDWDSSYHTKDKNFTPLSLVEDTDKKCRALRQSDQLYSSVDTEIIALLCAKVKPQQQQGGLTKPTLTADNSSSQKKGGYVKHRAHNQGTVRPAWFDRPPDNPNQTHNHENRVWRWCPKCGDNGKWVCTHTATTHTDNFVKKRKPDMHPGGRRPSPSPPPQASVATAIDHATIACLVAAQLATQFQANIAAPAPKVTPPDTLSGTQPFQGIPPEDQFMEAHEW